MVLTKARLLKHDFPVHGLFSWSIAQVSRDMLQNGVSHWYVCVKQGTKGGVSHPVGGIAGMAEKVSRDRGYRSETIALSRDMGPLRAATVEPCPCVANPPASYRSP